MANNKQFSVMVDNGGVLSYPQNFITANQLASFGSDVVGTFKQIKLGNETNGYIPGTITVQSTENDGLGGYNTELIISSNSDAYSSIVLRPTIYNWGDSSIQEAGIQISAEPVMGQVSISLNANSGDGGIYLNSYDIFLNCSNRLTVDAGYVSFNADSVSLPDNTTIGGKSVATGAPDNMVTTDTDQYIYGNKYFYGSAEFGEFDGGEGEVLFRNKIVANDGIHVPISPDSDFPVFATSKDKVSFAVPQYLRIFDTVNNGWTYTYKYVYLAQDANGNVTLAISDTKPNPNEVL